MPALLKAVRRFVDADSAGFFWVDSQGDMTTFYAERMLPTSARQLFFDRYFESRESSFRRVFRKRVQGIEPVIAVTPSPASERLPFYNEVFRPLDAHHVLYGVIKEQGHAIGQLSLYRPKSARPFSLAQRAELSSVIRYVAHGVSHRARQAGDDAKFQDTDDDAVFLVARDGSIRQLSGAAQKLLALATQGELGRDSTLTGIENAARPILQRLATQLRKVLIGETVGPPSVLLQNPWGRFILRAYAIGDVSPEADSSIVINIKRQEPMLLKFVEALNNLDLSPQQREIAVGLAKGASNRAIAQTMGISSNTVAYHVKQLFERLDTHDRAQLIANVMSRER